MPVSDDKARTESKEKAGMQTMSFKVKPINLEEMARSVTVQQYAMYMGIARDVVILINRVSETIFVSLNWESISGYSISEHSYSPIGKAIIHPEDYEHLDVILSELFTTGKMGTYTEYRLKLKNGSWRWYRAGIHPINSAQDNMESLLLVLQDINHKKESELQIRSSDAKFRLLFETMREGVVIVDNNDIVQFINQSCCDIFGYKPTDIIGKPGNEYLIIEEDRHVILEKNLARQQGIHDEYEVRGRKTNGELIWLQIKGAPLLNEEGIVTGSVGIMTDVTESKSLREQLLASQKMEAIGRLAGGIAHDFNNLLTIILGYSEDLLDDLPNDSPLREDVKEIINAGERAVSLTRQLLTFGRKQVLQTRILGLNEMLTNLKDMLVKLLGESIKLHYELTPDVAHVKADHAQMELMIMNLIINAKEAMPNGGSLIIETSKIRIDASNSRSYSNLHTGDYVKITVSDTGVGMDDKVVTRAFEPFFTTKEVGRGVGLGLSSVYGIVKQFEGHVSVESNVGKGTSFTIVVPAEHETFSTKPNTKKESSYLGKGEHVLVVEDEKPLLSYFTKLIKNLGYRVTSTSDSQDALDMIRNGLRPDLLITDVVMPNMNGRELADKVIAVHPDQRILFMSGFTDDAVVKHEVCNRGMPFIQKPFNSREIAIQIRSLLDNQKRDKPQAKILMLDDEDGIRTLFERSCKKRGHTFCGFATLDEALAALEANSFDILLIDMNLVGMDGEHALRTIREKGVDTPAIILSGAIDPDIKSKLHTLGVIDTIEKSFDNMPLLQFIESLIANQ